MPRTEKQQSIIDIMSHFFPESGYPDKIVVNETHILIISRLIDLSIGYQHKNYIEDLNSVVLYDRKTLKFITQIKTKYPCYNAVFFNENIFLSSGVYGDYLAGELLCFNIPSKTLMKCSDEKRPVHWLVKTENRLDIYTYKSAGYYENDAQKFHVINPTEKLFFDFDADEFEPFEEDEIEENINQDNVQNRLLLLQHLIQNDKPAL
jgi:hypothetical protein